MKKIKRWLGNFDYWVRHNGDAIVFGIVLFNLIGRQTGLVPLGINRAIIALVLVWLFFKIVRIR